MVFVKFLGRALGAAAPSPHGYMPESLNKVNDTAYTHTTAKMAANCQTPCIEC